MVLAPAFHWSDAEGRAPRRRWFTRGTFLPRRTAPARATAGEVQATIEDATWLASLASGVARLRAQLRLRLVLLMSWTLAGGLLALFAGSLPLRAVSGALALAAVAGGALPLGRWRALSRDLRLGRLAVCRSSVEIATGRRGGRAARLPGKVGLPMLPAVYAAPPAGEPVDVYYLPHSLVCVAIEPDPNDHRGALEAPVARRAQGWWERLLLLGPGLVAGLVLARLTGSLPPVTSPAGGAVWLCCLGGWWASCRAYRAWGPSATALGVRRALGGLVLLTTWAIVAALVASVGLPTA